jgi:hypothetical protein
MLLVLTSRTVRDPLQSRTGDGAQDLITFDLGHVWISLFYFRANTKQLMQINKFLSIIYEFIKVFYEKIVYKTYKLKLKLIYLHDLFFISSIQTGALLFQK